jgi:hypothetical protein
MLEMTGDQGPTAELSTRSAAGSHPRKQAASRRGHGSIVVAEIISAFLAAVLLLLLSRTISVNPLDRIGQVSALAGIALRFTIFGILLLTLVILAQWWRGGRLFPLASRLACAAVAGLATGIVGSGVLIALHGTTWPLFADLGDSGVLGAWIGGAPMPDSYPPLAINLIGLWADISDTSAAEALRISQIVGTAFFGPIAYLAWRLLLSPPWALALGLTASLPLIEPYKPYSTIVLVALIPVIIKMLTVLRLSGTLRWGWILGYGLILGAVLGVLFVTYSGWFVWSAAGVILAAAIVFPWRTGSARGVTLLAVAVVAFGIVAGRQLLAILRASNATTDDYFYFDTDVQPAYITMWRGDLPGNTGPWPPPGELAGVGLFSLTLVVGLGVAIAIAREKTVIIGLSLIMASAWIMRFWFASRMYETQTVQLYPRTSQLILHCLLLLLGFAAYFGVERLRGAITRDTTALDVFDSTRDRTYSPGRGARSATIGALSAALLLALFAGSATADRYMPREDDSVGFLAYVSQMLRQQDGQCPAFSRPDRCTADGAALLGRSKSAAEESSGADNSG